MIGWFNRRIVQYIVRTFLVHFTAKLIITDETVYLRGINVYERSQAPSSVLRGLLKIAVKSKSIPVEEIHIRLIGKSSNVVYISDALRRSTVNYTQSITINDAYTYRPHSSRLLKGTYTIPFQFTIDPNVSESLKSNMGSRVYHIEVEFKLPKNEHIKSITQRQINLVRCPLENSLIPFESIDSIGIWRNIMPYQLSLSSKACVLGDTIDIHLKTFPDLNNDRVGVVSAVKIQFLQKIKCPKRIDFPDGLVNSDYVVASDRLLLKAERINQAYFKGEDKEDPHKAFEKVWKVKLPNEMPFNVHPYTSNLDQNEFDAKDLRISHYILIVLTIKLIEEVSISNDKEQDFTKIRTNLTSSSTDSKKSIKLIHDSSDLIFKAPIYLLNKLALEYSPPPAYKNERANYSAKSSTWLCTGGKYEVDKPPKYLTTSKPHNRLIN